MKETFYLCSWMVFKVSDNLVHCAWTVVRQNIIVAVYGKARMLTSSSQKTKKKKQ